MYLRIETEDDADRHLSLVREAASRTQAWVASFQGDPLSFLRQVKFNTVGFHPIEHRPLNLIEQVNQTWTYAVAITAARQLLRLHPNIGALLVAPGAHMSLPLDIMSEAPGVVGAETFAAVDPANNRKMAKDLAKMEERSETYRYIFFMSPLFPQNKRIPKFERNGVQVWSVDF